MNCACISVVRRPCLIWPFERREGNQIRGIREQSLWRCKRSRIWDKQTTCQVDYLQCVCNFFHRRTKRWCFPTLWLLMLEYWEIHRYPEDKGDNWKSQLRIDPIWGRCIEYWFSHGTLLSMCFRMGRVNHIRIKQEINRDRDPHNLNRPTLMDNCCSQRWRQSSSHHSLLPQPN